MKRDRGFTLIELLVVIAIIGILSSVVLASLGTARQKARDATRISDVKNIQLALELYYDGRQAYPGQTAAATYDANTLFSAAGWTADPLIPTYLPVMPTDPNRPAGGTGVYAYAGADSALPTASVCQGAFAGGAPVACVSYILGASLERTDNIVLDKDADDDISPVFGAGDDGVCGANGAVANAACYDLRP